jgi:hypothetical protein
MKALTKLATGKLKPRISHRLRLDRRRSDTGGDRSRSHGKAVLLIEE